MSKTMLLKIEFAFLLLMQGIGIYEIIKWAAP